MHETNDVIHDVAMSKNNERKEEVRKENSLYVISVVQWLIIIICIQCVLVCVCE